MNFEHEKLGFKRDFTNWLKRQQKRAELVENVDFYQVMFDLPFRVNQDLDHDGGSADSTKKHSHGGDRKSADFKNSRGDVRKSVDKKGGQGGDRKSIDYIIPFDIAKHLCMMSGVFGK